MTNDEIKAQAIAEKLKQIKPGHPIWDEVWLKSQPDAGRVSHLDQLFIAKLELVAQREQNIRLRLALLNVLDRLDSEDWSYVEADWGRELLAEIDTQVQAAPEKQPATE